MFFWLFYFCFLFFSCCGAQLGALHVYRPSLPPHLHPWSPALRSWLAGLWPEALGHTPVVCCCSECCCWLSPVPTPSPTPGGVWLPVRPLAGQWSPGTSYICVGSAGAAAGQHLPAPGAACEQLCLLGARFQRPWHPGAVCGRAVRLASPLATSYLPSTHPTVSPSAVSFRERRNAPSQVPLPTSTWPAPRICQPWALFPSSCAVLWLLMLSLSRTAPFPPALLFQPLLCCCCVPKLSGGARQCCGETWSFCWTFGQKRWPAGWTGLCSGAVLTCRSFHEHSQSTALQESLWLKRDFPAAACSEGIVCF